MNEKYVAALLELMSKASKTEPTSYPESKAYSHLLKSHIGPFHLRLLRKSKDPIIKAYVERRYKSLYKIRKTLEEDFADKLQCSLDDIEEWERASKRDYRYMVKESKLVVEGKARDDCYIDQTPAIELIRHNSTVALTSPYEYIRTLAEILIEEDKDD